MTYRFPDIPKIDELRVMAKPPSPRWSWSRGELIVHYTALVSEVVGRVDKAEFADGFGFIARKHREDPHPRVKSLRRRFGSRISATQWLEEFARRLVREHDRALNRRA